jgi:hypothetical protein
VSDFYRKNRVQKETPGQSAIKFIVKEVVRVCPLKNGKERGKNVEEGKTGRKRFLRSFEIVGFLSAILRVFEKCSIPKVLGD